MSDPSVGGGFLPPPFPSPPASAPSTLSILPTPRSQPLKPGSQRELEFRNYVESKLVDISGRYENRHKVGEKDELHPPRASKDSGFRSFSEVARDLEKVVDVVWVSGTPSLQIPFFLNIALALSSYLPSFPFSPKRTFELVHKLDLAFSSLLNESNVETGEPLPGFSTVRRVTMTEKIRLRGLVERTRVNVANVANKGKSVVDDSQNRLVEATEDEDEDDNMLDDENDEACGSWEMEVARIYERTLVDIGFALDGAPNIGIPDWSS